MKDDLTTLEASEPTPTHSGPRAYLVLASGSAPPLTELPEGHHLSIGRSRSSGLPIDDDAVSRLHATALFKGGLLTVTDHGSRNGTYLNGQRLSGTAPLDSGDELALGGTRLVVAIQAGAEARGDGGPGEPRTLIALDPAMLRAVALAERAARLDSTVLLVGETGVGKEVLARHVHLLSPRRAAPFVAVNCGAITESLAESTLFGHERGAFTGASERHIGLFEQAQGGTLFLDEVGELSPPIQVRLLRVIQEREIQRLGGTKPHAVDLRLIAATNAPLPELVRSGRFREDLLYRLDVLRIEIPPLRERLDDIAPLAQRFLEEVRGEAEVVLTAAALDALRGQRWPGNVRELHNVIERTVAVSDRPALGAGDLIGLDSSGPSAAKGTLRHRVGGVEREAIVAALEATKGNQTRAARRLGISRRSLIYKMERFGLKPPPIRRDDPEG